MWVSVDSGKNLGERGPENGIILKDEEYKGLCRITLEQCPRYYAVTCGVYGLMFHTAFGKMDLYEEMKRDLQKFLEQDVTEKEAENFCEYFVKKY